MDADISVVERLITDLERRVAATRAEALPVGSTVLIAAARASIERAAAAAAEPRMQHLEAAARAVEAFLERVAAESALSA